MQERFGSEYSAFVDSQPNAAAAFNADSVVTLTQVQHDDLLRNTQENRRLNALINNPHIDGFLSTVRSQAAHLRGRFGDAHDRGKDAEDWFWLVGYLAGKCLRSYISGHRSKALHHIISSATALANWYEAIIRDESGNCRGEDLDIEPA